MRTAEIADLPKIVDLLAASALPTEDLEQQDLSLFVVEELGAGLGSVGGLERCGRDALLRSVATDEGLRGQGRARAMVAELEGRAARHGIGELYLLTETAADFFAGLGYAVRDRETVPDAVRASRQFSSICPDSAVVMAKRVASET
ncbi:MAG: arsenic resistance N-acetyltransferase ArsN2 [Pseudomonadota bacterium]